MADGMDLGPLGVWPLWLFVVVLLIILLMTLGFIWLCIKQRLGNKDTGRRRTLHLASGTLLGDVEMGQNRAVDPLPAHPDTSGKTLVDLIDERQLTRKQTAKSARSQQMQQKQTMPTRVKSQRRDNKAIPSAGEVQKDEMRRYNKSQGISSNTDTDLIRHSSRKSNRLSRQPSTRQKSQRNTLDDSHFDASVTAMFQAGDESHRTRTSDDIPLAIHKLASQSKVNLQRDFSQKLKPEDDDDELPLGTVALTHLQEKLGNS